jgi:L,D-peptidoglycan transpeptidase YkuD (ErfK/YbiS/YcfS/YnhG family)
MIFVDCSFSPFAKVSAFGKNIVCTYGKHGTTYQKQEGDKKTPLGLYKPVMVYYRADKIRRPKTFLPLQTLNQHHGWCDDINDIFYNHPVYYPYKASAENLWRSDSLYDIIIVLDYNFPIAEKGKGSAIFVHIMNPEEKPTLGCLGFSKKNLWWLIHRIQPSTQFYITS